MAKKAHTTKSPIVLSRRMRVVILPVFIVIAGAVLVLTILAIIVMPQINNSQRGVGANGFRAFEESGTTLGMDKLVTEAEVKESLGDKAKTIGKVDVSGVFNLNGSRGQTVTYPFTRADDAKASVYIDVMQFKDSTTLDSAHVTTGTVKAGAINGKPTYYMHAQTMGSDREYRLMIVSGLKVYKFVVVQPYRNITITEVSALAAMRKLAAKADL